MYLLFDIGASRTRWSTARGSDLSTIEIQPTPQQYARAIALFKKISAATPKLRSVVCGVAGHLDSKRGRLLASPHLVGWQGMPLKRDLEKIFGAKVCLQNDTALVGLGEATAGAGKGRALVAYVTVSTGVNGIRIVDGSLDRNASGFEIGHHIVSVLGQHPYTWEDFISGTAIEARSKLLPGKSADKSLWRDVERYLAYGLSNVIRFWSPEVIVIGGGVGTSGKIKLAEVARQVRALMTGYDTLPPIVAAKLGDRAGLLGGLQYLKTVNGR